MDPVTVGRYAYGAGFRGEDLAQMIAVAFGESSWNPDAVNASSGATGLWQILPSAHPEFSGQNLKDPAVNARAAYSVYSHAPAAGRITKNKWSAYQGLGYWSAWPAAQAAATAATAAGGIGAAASTVQDAASSAADTVTAPVRMAAGIWDTLSNPRTWLRVAQAVVGVGLVWFAVAQLEAGAISNSRLAQVAAGTTKKIATKGTV